MTAFEPETPVPVERAVDPTRADFERRYVAAGRPVLIEGATTAWPAHARWNEGYFAATSGARRVVVECYPEGIIGRPPRELREMFLREYLELLFWSGATEERHYLAEQPMTRHLPDLRADVRVPPLFDAAALREVYLFLGRETVSPAHYHSDSQALLTQVLGSKRVVLFPPAATAALRPFRATRAGFNFSRLDFTALDIARHPELGRVPVFECTVRPGEMLFIPIHWWHFVHGPDLSASVTFFWRASWRSWRFPAPGFHALVGLASQRVRSLLARVAPAGQRPSG